MTTAITTAMQNQIAQNYIAILGRNPDPAGFSFWVQTLADANNTPAAQTAIVNGFGNSAEFRGTYASLGTSAAVALLYQNVLLRAPDANGLAYWTTYANNLITSGQTITNAYAQTAAQIIYNASSQGSSDAAGINTRTAAAVASGTAAPTTTYTLTTGIDTFGNAGSAQQIFNAANGTFTPLDTLTGGTATNDTLNIANTGAYAAPVGATVTNVDIINLTTSAGGTITTAAGSGFTGVRSLNVVSAAGALTATADGTTAINVTNATPGGAAATTVNGGSSVNVTVTGGVADTIAIGATTAATGAVTASLTSATTAATAGTVNVTGGTTIAVTSLVSNTAAGAGVQAVTGAIGVTGNASTTAVTVTQSAGVTGAAAVLNVANTSNAVAATRGVTNAGVTIADANAGSTTAAATITTVTLQNYGASTISSNALTTLNLSNTGTTASGTLGLTYGLTTGNPTSLALNLGGGSLGVITDNGNKVATVNVALTANSTLAGITDTALRTVNLSGTGVLTLSAVNAAITSIVNTSTAAGLSADVSALAGLTSLNFASTSAANTVTLNATTQSYAGGTGVDTVTINADALQTITGGSGNDILVLSNTAATYTSANTVAKVTGFETLRVTNVAGGTYDMSVLTGFSTIQVNIAASTNTFTKVAAGTSLELQSATTAVTYQTASTTGATDSVSVNLKGATVTAANGGGTSGFTTTALTLQDANAVGIGNVTINSNASVFQGLHTITTLTDTALSNLAITGTGSLSITNAASTSTTLTISDNGTGTSATADGFGTFTSTGDVLGQINYSGTHAFTTTLLVDNVANLTIANANTGTTGVFTVAGHTNTNAAAASLTLTGAVAYTGNYDASLVAMTVSGATDNSIVNISLAGATGVKTVTLGNGANVVVTGAANDVITVGTGGNTITGAAGGDLITLGAGTASSAIVYSAAAETIQGNVTSGVTALTIAAGADRVVGATVGDTVNLTALTAGAYTAGLLSTTINAGGGTIDIVRGNWASATGIFTASSSGTDSILQWDSNGTGVGGAIETVVLVGFVNTASSTTADGLITLA